MYLVLYHLRLRMHHTKLRSLMFWGTVISWRMLSSIKMQLWNIKVLITLFKISTLIKHIYWKRHPGLFRAVQRAERAECSKSCWSLRRSCDADIQQAVSRAVSQYQTQLNAAQTCNQWASSCHSAIMRARQNTRVVVGKSGRSAFGGLNPMGGGFAGGGFQHPSRHSQCELEGATAYHSPDQPFSFQKQVWFGDRPNQPDLRSDTDLGEWVPPPPSGHNMPHSSTPYRVWC